jgi:hypothetical protein
VDNEDEVIKTNAIQWMVLPGGSFQACGRTMKRLPPGAFTVSLDCDDRPTFEARQLLADDLIDFPGSLPGKVLQEIEKFWKLGERFRQHGFLHRRGYLFYGKQGCGKSSLTGNVAFFCDDPEEFVTCVEQFRAVEPDRPMVCVFEDLDALIEEHGDSELLQWLDGSHQVNRTINLASTNYPEKLDRRIIARPRRFDRLLRIEAPDALVREAYFARKLPAQTRAERAGWVEASDGLPFAALAELIISVCCLGNDLEKSAALLRELDTHNPTNQEDNNEVTETLPLTA